MLPEIVRMIEMVGLEIGTGYRDFRNRGFGENFLGDIVDRVIGDFMNETDVLVFA